MKKLIIKDELCIGCGMCIVNDENHFESGEDGLPIVTTNDNLEDDNLLTAISGCPTDAIVIEEN